MKKYGNDGIEEAVYVTVVEDRHSGVDAYVFSNKNGAIEFAKDIAKENARHEEDIHEEYNENYIFLIYYSVEGCCAWVQEKVMNVPFEE